MVEIGRLIDDHVDTWTDEWKEGGKTEGRMDGAGICPEVKYCVNPEKSKIGISSKYVVGKVHKLLGQYKNKTMFQYSLDTN